MKSIVIMGVSGAGKSTLAWHIRKEYGHIKTSFADPLKLFCQEVFDMSHAQLWGDSELRDKRHKIKKLDGDFEYIVPRTALCAIGKAVRECSGEALTRRVIERAEHEELHGGAIVVDDCRYRHELESCLEAGFLAVRLLPEDGVEADDLEDQLLIPDNMFDLVIKRGPGVDVCSEFDKWYLGLDVVKKDRHKTD